MDAAKVLRHGAQTIARQIQHAKLRELAQLLQRRWHVDVERLVEHE